MSIYMNINIIDIYHLITCSIQLPQGLGKIPWVNTALLQEENAKVW